MTSVRLQMAQDDDKLSPEAKALRDTAPAFAALTRLISAIIAGVLIGWALDKFNVTSKGAGMKWGPVVGAVIGFIVFCYTAMKIKTNPQAVKLAKPFENTDDNPEVDSKHDA